MTIEEAITYANCLKNNYTINFDDMADFCDMAIKALEQEPCEDCISREQAKSAIRDRFKDLPSRVEINTILNDLPSVTPSYNSIKTELKSCEDCISRQAVIERLKREEKILYTPTGMNYLIRAIEEMPPVSPQPKIGHWIRFKEFENGYYHIKCSECGQYWSIDGHAKIFSYCFNCGAKMIESEL